MLLTSSSPKLTIAKFPKPCIPLLTSGPSQRHLIQVDASFLPFSNLCAIEVVYFSQNDLFHSSFILSARALHANMAKLLTIITGFMSVDLLSWTEFTINSDFKIAVNSLSGNTPIRDNYASLCTFYRNLPSWKLKKEVCHVPDRKFSMLIVSCTKLVQKLSTSLDFLD